MTWPGSYRNACHYFESCLESLQITESGMALETNAGFERIFNALAEVKADGKAIFVIGSGGSAAIASHMVNDLVNACGIRAFTLHDSALMTCMTNDYGYDQAFAKMLSIQMQLGDLLVAISSSGQSPTIHNAVKLFKSKGGKVISLSGFQPDNPLRILGDINLWLEDSQFGPIEIGHQFLVHFMTDTISKRFGMKVNGPLAMQEVVS